MRMKRVMMRRMRIRREYLNGARLDLGDGGAGEELYGEGANWAIFEDRASRF